MVKIIIKGELTDLNSYIKALNGSRWSGNSIKRVETDKVAWAAKLARTKPIKEYPVRIEYHWYCKDRRKDIDNVAFAKKFINDGLVEAGVLENDSQKFIAGFSDYFYIDKAKPRVEVLIHKATIA